MVPLIFGNPHIEVDARQASASSCLPTWRARAVLKVCGCSGLILGTFGGIGVGTDVRCIFSYRIVNLKLGRLAGYKHQNVFSSRSSHAILMLKQWAQVPLDMVCISFPEDMGTFARVILTQLCRGFPKLGVPYWGIRVPSFCETTMS